MEGPIKQKERRGNPRVPVALDAVLYYNTLMLPDCRVRNISPEGVFVSTDGHFLPDHASVDLSISPPDGVPQRLSAIVMRSNEQGVGLRLQDTHPVTLRNLIETLYSA